MKNFLLSVLSLYLLLSCKENNIANNNKANPTAEAFSKLWYAGKAEITSYSLQQARYGEIRDGEATLIFVTEDFLKDKLVKPDNPQNHANKVSILKLNMTKKFNTGIYPYSMMLSVFKPITNDGKENALKVNSSCQEWCGHTFSQLQLKGKNYQWQLHSYFEKEVEQDSQLDKALLEDELWNHIRINPATLPIGKLKVIPGLLWQRLSHTNIQLMDAELTLGDADTLQPNATSLKKYSINYPGINRILIIYFNKSFPHEIAGWQETYPDGFGENKKMLNTIAVKKTTIWLDYWKHNKNSDSIYRDSLQLNRHEQ